jgi:TPR repeat protein
VDYPGEAEAREKRCARIPEWTAAAAADEVDAQLALAWEYLRGDVVVSDIVTAWHWFDRAAASGREDALMHRAHFLQLRRVPQGIRELRTLAARNYWPAQYCLGRHYQTQCGRINQLRAAAWFHRSFKNGNPGGSLAKAGQMVRLAPFWLKALFAARSIAEFFRTFMRLYKQEENAHLLGQLQFRLKNTQK